jgi:hypothetical protein
VLQAFLWPDVKSLMSYPVMYSLFHYKLSNLICHTYRCSYEYLYVGCMWIVGRMFTSWPRIGMSKKPSLDRLKYPEQMFLSADLSQSILIFPGFNTRSWSHIVECSVSAKRPLSFGRCKIWLKSISLINLNAYMPT